jgi:ATP/maltotriose-dependent transcriptional regulator MalT
VTRDRCLARGPWSLPSCCTADACTWVTGRQDAAALLHSIEAANLFLVALDEERAGFRYHHLVRQLLRAELRARDWGRELALQLRAAEWFEATGDMRRAARYFLAARQVDRALALLQDRVVADYLHNPAPLQHGENPSPVDLPKLGVTSRSQALQRAVDLRLL